MSGLLSFIAFVALGVGGLVVAGQLLRALTERERAREERIEYYADSKPAGAKCTMLMCIATRNTPTGYAGVYDLDGQEADQSAERVADSRHVMRDPQSPIDRFCQATPVDPKMEAWINEVEKSLEGWGRR